MAHDSTGGDSVSPRLTRYPPKWVLGGLLGFFHKLDGNFVESAFLEAEDWVKDLFDRNALPWQLVSLPKAIILHLLPANRNLELFLRNRL